MGELSFTSPALLAALLALPAIWFLLRATPPAPQRVSFPAFDILKRLQKTAETPHRTPWWVLLLRLLIAGLAIFGLAGPILNAPPPPDQKGSLVLVVDDSWIAAPGWRLRRDALRMLGEQAIEAKREVFVIQTTAGLDEPPSPQTGADIVELSRSIEPRPLLPDYAKAAAQIAALGAVKDAETIWLADGVDHAGANELAASLRKIGKLRIEIDKSAASLALAPPTRDGDGLNFVATSLSGAAWTGDIIALARDGRELGRTSIAIPAGFNGEAARLDLPLALQNDMAQSRIDGVASAGAVQLVDARERRALIGFIASGEANIDPLLAGQHYIRKALEPYALFVTDSLENLLASDASVIVMDDVGVVRDSDAEALRAWIEKGGVVLRFAGPNLATAAGDGAPLLLPVPLRGGGRAFGGALTWETPQPIASLSAEGPFAGMAAPGDVLIRRQVLAEPGGDTSLRSWASLSDGTPLVTGETIGAGALVLFHVTATPDWSDLPLSNAFIAMLRKVIFLSTLGPNAADGGDQRRVSPFRMLDGFGVLKQASRDLKPATIAEIDSGSAIGRPPGLYGAPEAPIALNAVSADMKFQPLATGDAETGGYAIAPPVRIGPPLIIVALVLLLIDALVALRLAGRLSFAIALACLMTAAPERAVAAPLDRPIDERAIEAALDMRLAYVRTGDPATDRIAEAGLKGLTAELTRRTSAEPAAPVGVDPETDDLSVYPLLYWPVAAGAAAPSDRALANIETFTRFGGLIVFDTRDDERAITGAETPEGAALKRILGRLDLPPLTPVAANHVLYRSFYLLSDLTGRMASRPVWVQAGEGPNDSVTPVIIGGRDWAGAWAINAAGEPLLPVRATAAPCADVEGAPPRNPRECALRAGVNIVMVALTGNYKSDQVHTPVLLERLGRE